MVAKHCQHKMDIVYIEITGKPCEKNWSAKITHRFIKKKINGCYKNSNHHFYTKPRYIREQPEKSTGHCPKPCKTNKMLPFIDVFRNGSFTKEIVKKRMVNAHFYFVPMYEDVCHTVISFTFLGYAPGNTISLVKRILNFAPGRISMVG